MRNYTNIEHYLDELRSDIYQQPPDEGHTEMARNIIEKWFRGLDAHTVLDVGCGQGFCQPIFESLGFAYTGVTLGDDYDVARGLGRNVLQADFTFLDMLENKSFDVVFSRHSLEHSTMPLLTLMEWERVAQSYLCLVLPRPSYWTWVGRNHYAMMSASQARFLLDRAGWKPVWEDNTDLHEFRFMCEKVYRVSKLDDNKEEYDDIREEYESKADGD